MLDDFIFLIDDKMKKSLDVLKFEFSKLVVNKINVNLIRSIFIIIDNNKFCLDNISVINIENNIIFIKPFDKQHLQIIYNEIIKLNFLY